MCFDLEQILDNLDKILLHNKNMLLTEGITMQFLQVDQFAPIL